MGENLGGYSLNSDNLRYTSMVPQLKSPGLPRGWFIQAWHSWTMLDVLDPIFFGSSQQILVRVWGHWWVTCAPGFWVTCAPRGHKVAYPYWDFYWGTRGQGTWGLGGHNLRGQLLHKSLKPVLSHLATRQGIGGQGTWGQVGGMGHGDKSIWDRWGRWTGHGNRWGHDNGAGDWGT